MQGRQAVPHPATNFEDIAASANRQGTEPLAAGDRLLVHTGKGELAVVKATPEAYEELSREKVTSGGVCWTMPILVDGRIYMRSSKGQVVARDHRLKD